MSLSPQHQPSQGTTQLSQYYQHINDCPLSAFIEVSTKGNLSALIISGFPSEPELVNAWNRIVSEYGEAIGGEDQQLAASLLKQIAKLEITIEQIELLVSALSRFYCGKFVTELNKLLNTHFVFDVTKPEEYDRLLQNCLNRSKGFKIKLDLKLAQFEAIQKREKSGGELTREYFLSVLITLSDHAKYPIRETDITVYEYCERIRRLNQFMKAQEAKVQK